MPESPISRNPRLSQCSCCSKQAVPALADLPSYTVNIRSAEKHVKMLKDLESGTTYKTGEKQILDNRIIVIVQVLLLKSSHQCAATFFHDCRTGRTSSSVWSAECLLAVFVPGLPVCSDFCVSTPFRSAFNLQVVSLNLSCLRRVACPVRSVSSHLRLYDADCCFTLFCVFFSNTHPKLLHFCIDYLRRWTKASHMYILWRV